MQVKFALSCILFSCSTFRPMGISFSGVRSWAPADRILLRSFQMRLYQMRITLHPLDMRHGRAHGNAGEIQTRSQHHLVDGLWWTWECWWHATYLHIEIGGLRMLGANGILSNAFVFALILFATVVDLQDAWKKRIEGKNLERYILD